VCKKNASSAENQKLSLSRSTCSGKKQKLRAIALQFPFGVLRAEKSRTFRGKS
jgi:hypothetical protein